MEEKVLEIHDFLPVARRSTVENDYILHLWDAYLTLDTLGDAGRGFSIMPFHIMFMLALQYKILRIATNPQYESLCVYGNVWLPGDSKLLVETFKAGTNTNGYRLIIPHNAIFNAI